MFRQNIYVSSMIDRYKNNIDYDIKYWVPIRDRYKTGKVLQSYVPESDLNCIELKSLYGVSCMFSMRPTLWNCATSLKFRNSYYSPIRKKKYFDLFKFTYI